MNIIEKTQPNFITIEEKDEEVLFRYENGEENKFIEFLKDKNITFSTLCRPTSFTNIKISIEDYLSILNHIVNIEIDNYTSIIHLNNAVVHINNVGNGGCDKIEVDPNNMNVYKDGEELFSIFWDIHEITQFSIATDIGDTRYGPHFIPLKWFENEFKRIEERLDYEADD